MPRKSFDGETEMTCWNCNKKQTVKYHYYPGCPERGEYMFSLGSPAEPASVSADSYTCECGEEITEDMVEKKVFDELSEDD